MQSNLIPPVTLKSIELMVDKLKVVDAYTATAPLLANALISLLNRNEPKYIKRYIISRDQMLEALAKLDVTPKNYPEWMCNYGFTAWMWGVVAFAADIIKDVQTLVLAKQKLNDLLAKQEEQANLIFLTWAWGFRGSLNQIEYKASYEKIKIGAEELTAIYRKSKTQNTKSDALWAWIMNLFAAAKTYHLDDYIHCKNKIINIDNTKSIAEALTTGLLLRTSQLNHYQSNDFAALALAMVCYAAAMIGDKETFAEVLKATQGSIRNAHQESANAEYILAILYLQLAFLATRENLHNEVK